MKPKKGLVPLRNLSAGHLVKALQKADAKRTELVTEMINAGRGRETITDTMARVAVDPGDELGAKFLASVVTLHDLRREEDRRREYNGTLRPVPPNPLEVPSTPASPVRVAGVSIGDGNFATVHPRPQSDEQ